MPLTTTIKRSLSKLTEAIGQFFIDLLDLIFGSLQKIIGLKAMPYVFVLPNLLIFGIFILFPMLLNFRYAFTGGTSFFPNQREFVGFANFEQLLTCQNFLDPNSCREDLFWRALFNTAGYVFFQVGLMVVMALITALVLNRKIRARGFFRSVYFYPVLLSPIVVALIWKWILQENGLFNGLLTTWGYERIPFLVNADWAQFWVIIISVWAFMGFYTLILLAGLQSIPADLYEAASMDGANEWKSFWNVTLPLLMPQMVVVLVLALIRAVQIFDVVFAFTGGGPGTATLYLVQYIYSKGFASPSRQFGLAAAASLIMAGILIVLTIIQQIIRKEEE